MAKLETTLNGNFSQILNRIEDGIVNGSVSASLEDSSDFRSNGARCSVRVFERYSYMGGNRVSLSVTLFKAKTVLFIFPQLLPVEARQSFLKSILSVKRHFLIN